MVTKKKKTRKKGKLDHMTRIAVDPKVLVGKPVIKGTRIAVEFIVDLLANGWSHDQVLENYDQLSNDDILAALSYAADRLKDERVYPLSVG